MPKKISMLGADAYKSRYANSGANASSTYQMMIAKNTTWFAQATSDTAEQNWATGVTVAANEKRRNAGLKSKTSQSLWSSAAITKGGAIIGQRITAAADKQSTAWAPYYNALAALTLPDKTPGDPIGNLTRNAGLVVKTLVNVKRAKEGAAPLP